MRNLPLFFTGAISVLLMSCAQLPSQSTVEEIVWLDQNWTTQERQMFHYETQGTMTLPLPFEWFAALEQPGFKLFGTKGLIIENGYLSRLGFISGEISSFNQAGLPIGFSVDYNVTNPAISKTKFNAVGLTCAACHTGQMNVGGKSVRYDGGPAMTNLSEFTSVLGIALIETYLDKSKFDRFSQRILGVTNTPSKSKELRSAVKHAILNQIRGILKPKLLEDAGIVDNLKDNTFESSIKAVKGLIHSHKDKPTQEGFTRLDALNRIGNTVFGVDTGNYANTATINAPVSYPYIWNTSWFLWVQYDASIMGPMIRNSGEAMGVFAQVNLDKNSSENFKSSVPLDNLYWMETLLAGKTLPTKDKKFGGLSHPKWDENIFGKVEPVKHKKGAKLYAELCQSCHLAPIDSDEFWSTNWTKPDENGRSFLDLPIVNLDYIGTDPEQANVLRNRKVDTSGVGLNTHLYVEQKQWFENNSNIYYGANKGQCEEMLITDGKKVPFSVALGAAVQEVNDYWYKQNKASPAKQHQMNGYRKNCLRAPFAYKARPLNGIWATAPFLHNGAIPNMFALLSPQSDRPAKFYLGNLDYDKVNMGYATGEGNGFFQLDTSIIGNSNKGHEFSDGNEKGVIGRALSVQERYELIEYLKDIREVK
ncbi:MAG: di-heme-cytochrome C peroxidase [Gammaproteobacteria bacterium]|nr:di-heme-cytochrome C peroxidase [Gammaproteobacteria bacterium]